MKKILGIILLLSIPLFGQVTNKYAVYDSAAVTSGAVESPVNGSVPIAILLAQGIADSVTIEGTADGTNWFWIQSAAAKYTAGGDSSMNAGIVFDPDKMIPFWKYRFTLDDTISTSGGDSFIVPFGRVYK